MQKRADRRKARGQIDKLTPREFEVLRLVIVGLLNKQIAAELKTAEKTIKVHRGRVMQKLGLTSCQIWCVYRSGPGFRLAVAIWD